MSQVQFNSQISDQIKVSDEAVKQLIALTESEDGVNGVRIFVSGGGCGGMSYGMTFVDQPTQFDATLDKQMPVLYLKMYLPIQLAAAHVVVAAVLVAAVAAKTETKTS